MNTFNEKAILTFVFKIKISPSLTWFFFFFFLLHVITGLAEWLLFNGAF